MTSFDARRVHHTFQDFRASVSGLSERYPKISASLGSLAFGLIYLYGLPNLAEAASHPALLGVDNFIKNISPFGVPLGRDVGGVTVFYVRHVKRHRYGRCALRNRKTG